MIKLPKCPHCWKLMVPHLSRGIFFDKDMVQESKVVVTYLCPEKPFEMAAEPEWIEVEESFLGGRAPKV